MFRWIIFNCQINQSCTSSSTASFWLVVEAFNHATLPISTVSSRMDKHRRRFTCHVADTWSNRPISWLMNRFCRQRHLATGGSTSRIQSHNQTHLHNLIRQLIVRRAESGGTALRHFNISLFSDKFQNLLAPNGDGEQSGILREREEKNNIKFQMKFEKKKMEKLLGSRFSHFPFWKMDGTWKREIMTGKWLENDWKMTGKWLKNDSDLTGECQLLFILFSAVFGFLTRVKSTPSSHRNVSFTLWWRHTSNNNNSSSSSSSNTNNNGKGKAFKSYRFFFISAGSGAWWTAGCFKSAAFELSAPTPLTSSGQESQHRADCQQWPIEMRAVDGAPTPLTSSGRESQHRAESSAASSVATWFHWRRLMWQQQQQLQQQIKGRVVHDLTMISKLRDREK